MTYGELISKATVEERREVHDRVCKIIGTKEQAVIGARDLSDKINRQARWQKEFERLSKVFLEHGAEALSLHYVNRGGNWFEGVTAIYGKKWTLYGNHGYTERSHYCGTLYIEGVGTVFTSGRLDKVFDYILNN